MTIVEDDCLAGEYQESRGGEWTGLESEQVGEVQWHLGKVGVII